MSQEPILLLEEAAALLKVSPDWLQRSTCPRIRNAQTVRWDRDTCLTWFRSYLTVKAAA